MRGHGPGYASPIVTAIGGIRQVITMTDRAVVGLDVVRGALLWEIPFPAEWYEEVRRYKVADSATWGHPALAGQAIVIRDASSVAAWALN